MKIQAIVIGALLIAVVVTGLLRLLGTADTPLADDRSGRVAGSAVTRLTADLAGKLPFAPPPRLLSDQEPNIFAQSAYLVDVESFYPLYAKNERTPVPIASTTKLMTAVIVTEEYGLDEVVTISTEAATAIGSDIVLMPGEQITVEALLKGLLIQSGNDAAVALAEHSGTESFVRKMNSKAVQLGMTDTEFRDPAGLDDTGRSSARDLGVLAAYALRNEVIRGIARITEAQIESVDLRYTHRLETSNRLLKNDHPLFLDSATGLKTGYTPEAGHCLVASAERNGHQLVSVILKTDEDTVEASAKESRKLLQWGFSTYEWSDKSTPTLN